jgi:hypothetical protein
VLALNYLYSGLVNIANIHPEWGTSFKVNESKTDLHTYWFTHESHSTGNLAVMYNLTGLRIYRITYETSCKLSIQITNTNSTTQACLNVMKDDDEPLINLGKENFKFYCYKSAKSAWELINPSTDPVAFANGTYLIDIPSEVDPYAYVVQVEDSRGIIVVASSFSRYSCALKWMSASASGQNYVENDVSDVDSSEDVGTHSDFLAQQSFNGVFDTLTEGKTSKNFLAKEGTFTKITATGAQTVTGVGFLPKAVIFWWTRQTSFGELASPSIGYGFATNYGGPFQNRGVAFASDDNAGTSNTGRRRSETYSIIILSSGTPVLAAQASVTAFNGDGFVLNWQTNEARADIIHYIALGGADLTNAKASTFSLTASGGTQDVTGVGFQPDFAMFLWTFTEAADTSTANGEVGMGFAVSSTKRGALVTASGDGLGTTNTWQQQRTDACTLLLNPADGSQDARVDFSQFLADGFRVNRNDAPASATPIFYLALKGGSYDVGSFNSPTSTGNQEIRTLGFQPALVMLATQGHSAGTGIGSTAELSLGAASSATNRGATWFEDTDNLGTSDNEMETLNTRIIQWRDRTGGGTFTLRGSADFASVLSNGFRLSWSNVETNARQIIYVGFGGSNYELDLEEQWTNTQYNGTTEQLAIYADTTGATENLRVDVRYNSSWVNIIANVVNGWNNVSVLSYLNAPTFTIRFKGTSESTDGTQDSWRIDVTLLKVSPTQDLYQLLQNATVVVEMLQNGTMRWLGQNLQLATQAKPIPPVPVKAIHVNQTINGVNREVPFQIEDWASEYRIPLGLTSNASVFSSTTMLVFLVNSKVSKVTIWWNGSDAAIQTSNAYVNRYFTVDTVQRTLTNGILNLRIDFSSNTFRVVSTTGTATNTAEFMRINNDVADWGYSEPTYAITAGPVRDVIHHEVEWGGGGVSGCPNFYAHIVITLPANATYYTYQLRLMFVQSQQSRTITDACPIKITVSSGSQQTENGISGGFPIVQSGTGTFYNASSVWQHHWSQIVSGTKGAGIIFRDEPNKMLYTFDTSATKTGALKVGAQTIELLPVTMSSVSFTTAKDLTWSGAVVTFDGTTPIYENAGGKQTGLWITAECPPTITVTTET